MTSEIPQPERFPIEPAPSPAPPPHPVAVRMPSSRPTVTYTILGLTALVFIFQLASDSILGYDWPVYYGVKVNELIQAGELWRLFTPMLLHGSFLHIGFNMYALYILGPGLERHFGHGRFLLLYLLGGFAGNVVSMTFTAAPSLGSSTAIFGIIGAQGVFAYRNQKVFGSAARRSLRSVINIAAINFVIGLSPGIDNWGHMGGLVAGLAFTWFAGPVYHMEGIAPEYSLVDERDSSDMILAGLGVGMVFAFLAMAVIFLRGN